ncbi:hypothetical protein HGRIS_014443 [Hohenbuehelia grisea]|uniref:TauD/TfdA-like domain-containing protein n=1 Tax=Hohenbuehelia grisea TaxID=104357 RepID=A0ABR3JTP6_9AGAR
MPTISVQPFAAYKPRYPDVKWEPLQETPIDDRGLAADPELKELLSAAAKVNHMTRSIGTEIHGVDLKNLTDRQKDELALLVARRGVVFFRDQKFTIHEQLALHRYFGPIHKHGFSAIPKAPGLEEVHVVYHDKTDPPAIYNGVSSKVELWHSDVSYELQPPGLTSLNILVGPEYGGDTMWSSGYGLYSSLSPGLQRYVEGLKAVHSGRDQAQGMVDAKRPVRRWPVDTIHPVVRVHPVTGWKSIYVDPVFTTHIADVPKSESLAILDYLYSQLSGNPELQVRFKWAPGSVAIWDNRIVTHSAIHDYWPATRHALRVITHGEKPMSVEEFEAQTGRKAKDRASDDPILARQTQG